MSYRPVPLTMKHPNGTVRQTKSIAEGARYLTAIIKEYGNTYTVDGSYLKRILDKHDGRVDWLLTPSLTTACRIQYTQEQPR